MPQMLTLQQDPVLAAHGYMTNDRLPRCVLYTTFHEAVDTDGYCS